MTPTVCKQKQEAHCQHRALQPKNQSSRWPEQAHAPDPGSFLQHLTSEAGEQLACSQRAQLHLYPLFPVLAGTVC